MENKGTDTVPKEPGTAAGTMPEQPTGTVPEKLADTALDALKKELPGSKLMDELKKLLESHPVETQLRQALRGGAKLMDEVDALLRDHR